MSQTGKKVFQCSTTGFFSEIFNVHTPMTLIVWKLQCSHTGNLFCSNFQCPHIKECFSEILNVPAPGKLISKYLAFPHWKFVLLKFSMFPHWEFVSNSQYLSRRKRKKIRPPMKCWKCVVARQAPAGKKNFFDYLFSTPFSLIFR